MLQQIALMIALSGASSLAIAFLVKVINRVRKNSADYIRSGTRFIYCFLDENDPASFGYREVYGHEYRIKGRMIFVPYSKKRIYLDDRTGSIVASILHDHEADVSLREVLVAVDDVYDKMDDISKMSDKFRQEQNTLAINDVKHEVQLSAIKRRLKKDDKVIPFISSKKTEKLVMPPIITGIVKGVVPKLPKEPELLIEEYGNGFEVGDYVVLGRYPYYDGEFKPGKAYRITRKKVAPAQDKTVYSYSYQLAGLHLALFGANDGKWFHGIHLRMAGKKVDPPMPEMKFEVGDQVLYGKDESPLPLGAVVEREGDRDAMTNYYRVKNDSVWYEEEDLVPATIHYVRKFSIGDQLLYRETGEHLGSVVSYAFMSGLIRYKLDNGEWYSEKSLTGWYAGKAPTESLPPEPLPEYKFGFKFGLGDCVSVQHEQHDTLDTLDTLDYYSANNTVIVERKAHKSGNEYKLANNFWYRESELELVERNERKETVLERVKRFKARTPTLTDRTKSPKNRKIGGIATNGRVFSEAEFKLYNLTGLSVAAAPTGEARFTA